MDESDGSRITESVEKASPAYLLAEDMFKRTSGSIVQFSSSLQNVLVNHRVLAVYTWRNYCLFKSRFFDHNRNTPDMIWLTCSLFVSLYASVFTSDAAIIFSSLYTNHDGPQVWNQKCLSHQGYYPSVYPRIVNAGGDKVSLPLSSQMMDISVGIRRWGAPSLNNGNNRKMEHIPGV